MKLPLSIKTLLLLSIYQLVSCQTKQTEKMETGFVIQESKLYYNSKEIALGMSTEKFTEAMGMYDRIYIDSSGGHLIKDYFWKTKLIKLNKHSENDYYIITKYNKDKKTGEISEDTESYDKVSMDEIISKYGKYDSIKEEKTPLLISKYFIWDELGITLTADTGNDEVIGKILIQTLHPKKYEKLDLGLVRTIEEKSGIPLNKEQLERRKKDIEYINSVPKKEYTGNFTYNGKTINIKEIGYMGWEKAIKELSLEGSDFDPPGDSPAWSRWIKETNEIYITLERFSNALEYEELSPDKVGNFDFIQSIGIWNYENYGTDNQKRK